jgi:hypothetical protein
VNATAHAAARIGRVLHDDPALAPPRKWRVSGPLHARANSCIYYGEAPGLDHAVSIKLCLQPYAGTPDPATARQQFEALSRVHARMAGGDGYDVPRPLALLEREGLVLSEWIAGTSLTERLYTPQAGRAGLVRDVARAGEWLQRFHRAQSLEPGFLDVEEKLAQVRHIGSHALSRRRAFCEAAATLERAAPSVARLRLPRSWVHGDFKADNLLYAPGRVSGIDVHARHDNVCLYDLASFLNHLELAAWHPRGWHLVRQRRCLSAAFVDACLGREATRQRLALEWVRLYSMLAVWALVWREPRAALRLRLLDFSFQWEVRRLVRRLRAEH